MMEYEILCYPNARLREKSVPINDFNQELRELVKDMFDVMKKVEGIGLAAIQIGKALRIAVINVDEPFVIINPTVEIMEVVPTVREEGCLSIPGVRAEIARPSRIKVAARDEEGKKFHIKATGLLAVCLLHEIDHMDGVLFIDRLSPLKKSTINSQLRNLIALHDNKGAP